MTARALQIAQAVGRALPAFPNARAARSALLRQRDEALVQLRALVADADFTLDLTAESLRPLEAWYLDLHRRRRFARIGATRREVEDMMSFYFGAVAKRVVPGAKWIVEGQGFVADRYEIGIQVGLSVQMIVGVCDDWHAHAGVRGGALLRSFRSKWDPSPAAKKRPAKPAKAPTTNADIRAAIETQLGLASTPILHGGTLYTLVRHRLRDDSIPGKHFFALLAAMVKTGRVARTEGVRDGKARYALGRPAR